mmetsp:Transcript_47990/g.153424  ORF Transcript_47990/g.153424 Transcript_47990/m.153424 type:complete len:248 (-) Transcript_47990:383-1126(-)
MHADSADERHKVAVAVVVRTSHQAQAFEGVLDERVHEHGLRQTNQKCHDAHPKECLRLQCKPEGSQNVAADQLGSRLTFSAPRAVAAGFIRGLARVHGLLWESANQGEEAQGHERQADAQPQHDRRACNRHELASDQGTHDDVRRNYQHQHAHERVVVCRADKFVEKCEHARSTGTGGSSNSREHSCHAVGKQAFCILTQDEHQDVGCSVEEHQDQDTEAVPILVAETPKRPCQHHTESQSRSLKCC